MAAKWDPEQLSAILSSTRPNLNRAERDHFFPKLSREDEDAIRELDPSSTQGRMLCAFHDLLNHRTNPREAAEIFGSLTSNYCSTEEREACLLWGSICQYGETWPEAELSRLADMVVELAKLQYPLPDYPYDTDNPVQGSSSFAELPGFGHEIVGRLQGPKSYSLQFMTAEARRDAKARTEEGMTGRIVSGDVVVAVRDLYRNINTFTALLSCHYVRGTLLLKNMDLRGMAHHPIVNALEHELSLNEVTQHADGSATMPDQDWTAFRSAQPSISFPAATQWLSILGRSLFDGLSSMRVGPLWEAQGGGEKVTMERWRFWQSRLRYFAENDTILGEGIKESCRKAADRMDEAA